VRDPDRKNEKEAGANVRGRIQEMASAEPFLSVSFLVYILYQMHYTKIPTRQSRKN
jgi:hypothetical protein